MVRGEITAEDQELSDHTTIAVYTVEDVSNLQRQLAKAREKITAKDRELAASDKRIKVM